jgi:alkylation response protein AidB-like acyl-CoA dehydrogenase
MNQRLVDMEDTRFVLYRQLNMEGLFDALPFADHSQDTVEMIMTAAEKLAVNDFAPVNSEGDRIGCTWKDGTVTAPPPFHGPFRKYCDGGWIALAEDYAVGGQQVPLALHFACQELFFSANHSLAGYMGLTHSAAKVIETFGTEAQKNAYMIPLYEGRYGGTMNLTEPQAGSDVGAIRTRAARNEDGTYAITGTKIFITGGEHDLTENIIHIVLARIEGDPAGTKGLSCFIVPKIRLDEKTGTALDNDVTCAGIEHKMGMKGSATCVLNFGDRGRCMGELLGPQGKGIVVMFHMMNEQRVLVGLQGLAQASTAYLHALAFARERKQGNALDGGEEGQAAIIRHPDIQRNLLWMKCHTEGMRALILYTVSCMDRMAASGGAEERETWRNRVEVLTPVCKAYCTDRGFEACTRAMQVMGGYGYCREYLVEQFCRDCKITSIYEGTNGIQALDLFGRKIRMKNGNAWAAVTAAIGETIGEAAKLADLAPYAEQLAEALAALEDTRSRLVAASSGADVMQAYAWASPFLEICGDVMLGWMLLWQARVARQRLGAGGEGDAFLTGKMLTAKFYIGELLPAVHGKTGAIMRNDGALREFARQGYFL